MESEQKHTILPKVENIRVQSDPNTYPCYPFQDDEKQIFVLDLGGNLRCECVWRHMIDHPLNALDYSLPILSQFIWDV